MFSHEFLTTILPIILGGVSAPLGAWLGSRLEKKKYNIVLDELTAKIETQHTTNRNSELKNVREANDILMETVVRPLETQINGLQIELERLRQAVAKITSCNYGATCPVVKCLRYDTQGSGYIPNARGETDYSPRSREPTATA